MDPDQSKQEKAEGGASSHDVRVLVAPPPRPRKEGYSVGSIYSAIFTTRKTLVARGDITVRASEAGSQFQHCAVGAESDDSESDDSESDRSDGVRWGVWSDGESGDESGDASSDEAAAPPLDDESGWAEIRKLSWGLRSDGALLADQVRARRRALSRPERRRLLAWVLAKGEELAAAAPELGEKIAGTAALEIVALGQHWFASALREPSLVHYLMSERQEESLFSLALLD